MKIAVRTEDQSGLKDQEVSTRALASGDSLLDKITPKFVREARATFRESGFRGVVKRYGWKVFAAFFLYYLIRDSFLYIFIPYVLTRGLL